MIIAIINKSVVSSTVHIIIFPCRWTKKKKAGTDVWFGQGTEDMPNKKVAPLVPDIFASYTGPDKGLAAVYGMENANTQDGAPSE